MDAMTRQVTGFLNRMYPSEPVAAAAERSIAAKVTAVDVRTLLNDPSSSFPPSQKSHLAKDYHAGSVRRKISDI